MLRGVIGGSSGHKTSSVKRQHHILPDGAHDSEVMLGIIKNDSQITDLRIMWSEKVRGCQIDIEAASPAKAHVLTTIGEADRIAGQKAKR